MKILFTGKNRDTDSMWLSLMNEINSRPQHEAAFYAKPHLNQVEEFGSVPQSPMSDPDIIFMWGGTIFIAREEYPHYGISSDPMRILYNLGNRQIGEVFRDWRAQFFNKYYFSYNPCHKKYRHAHVPTLFDGKMKFMPLPFDATGYQKMTLPTDKLKCILTMSSHGMAGSHGKSGELAKQIEDDLGFKLDTKFWLTRAALDQARQNNAFSFGGIGGIFGKAELESMAMGLPVVMWSHSETITAYEQRLGRVNFPILTPNIPLDKDNPIDETTVDIVAGVRQIFQDIKDNIIDLDQVSQDCYDYMQNTYTIAKIADMYLTRFETLLGA